MAKIGRPTKCTKDIIKEICFGVSAGSNITRLCKERKDLPAESTVYRWLVESEYTDFQERYARARESRANVRFDAMEEIIQKVATGEYHPNQGRVMIDAIKWQMGKENKIYNDNRHEFRVETDLTADLEARLNLAAEKSRKALADLAKSKQIQHQPVDNIQDAEVLKVETDDAE